ncbi:MAG: hypothetical protein WC770_08510 [Phycisphaerae bacterium]
MSLVLLDLTLSLPAPTSPDGYDGASGSGNCGVWLYAENNEAIRWQACGMY